MAAVDFCDPFSHVVKEVTVVGHGKDSAGVLSQVLLKPKYALSVQVVGGLIKEQEVGLLQEKLAQCYAAALTTGEDCDIGISRRAAQCVHGLLELGIDVPGISSINGFLKLAHLVQERLVVRIRVGHFFGDLIEALDLAVDLANTLLDIAQDGLFLVQRRFLQEDAHGVAGAQAGLAV